MSPVRLVCFLWLALVVAPLWADPLQFQFHAPASVTDADTGTALRDLAERVLPVYQDADTERYLSNLSMLQMVAGNYAAAADTRRSLQDRQRSTGTVRSVSLTVVFDIYTHAKATEAADRIPFAQAFGQSFRAEVSVLGDQDAYAVATWFEMPPSSFQGTLQNLLDRLRAKPSVDLDEALELVRGYVAYDAYRSFSPLVGPLVAADEQQRYVSQDDVLIEIPDGPGIHARLVRPKRVSKPLPALLEFTIQAPTEDPKASAAHGYVGIVAYTRGKSVSGKNATKEFVMPFEHDGEDASAVIDWIARQPWSDGRVGMYGNGYSGFAAWAAAGQAPEALKAIATADPMVPGISFPMESHVFKNAAYRWAIANTETKYGTGGDAAAWRALDRAWYASGKPYRDLDRLAKMPSRVFRRWLNHPSYDLFWRKLIPFREEFADIDIPVLTMAGYYASGEVGAWYYFSRHHRYRRNADHTLLLGPYDDAAMREGVSSVLHGYALDAAALVDLRELRYQWFASIFKGGARPPLLKGRINYEVMGANEWRYAASLDAMAGGTQRLYLDATAVAGERRLARNKPPAAKAVLQTVDFADRSDADRLPSADIASKSLDVHNGVVFASEPLRQPVEISGALSGRLDFKINKLDVDLNVTLYEQSPDGGYLRLSDPYEFRASYVRDSIHRHLLKAGERQQLAFKSEQMMSRRLQPGSRMVLVLGVNKRPDREINYGTGNDVGAESVADAAAPLRIEWYGSSYIDIPGRR
jgi:putative CocE/NonD family hydrolase